MAFFFILTLVFLVLQTCSSAFAALDTLEQGASLSVEKSSHVLVSNNGVFAAGFFPAPPNKAFYFAVWITKSAVPTVVWTANRDQPVNRKRSKLSLLKSGILVLFDAGQMSIWSTDITSQSFPSPVQLKLYDNGNLVLRNTNTNQTIWESFGSPTDTLLPQQQLTRNRSLVSSKARGNLFSGPYKLYFDNDNVLHLLFERPEVSSRYWPPPYLKNDEVGRFEYSNLRVAEFNSSGHFISTDKLEFFSSDYGAKSLKRLTLDPDGNLRLYSLEGEINGTWVVSWQSIFQSCKVHGVCGPNSICRYDPVLGRWCSCLPGHKFKNPSDWSSGCAPEFDLSSCKNNSEFSFLPINHIEFYGNDEDFLPNSTLEICQNACLKLCNCKGFQFKIKEPHNNYECYLKGLLYNGYISPNFKGDLYLKLPKANSFSTNSFDEVSELDCKHIPSQILLRKYAQPHPNEVVKYILWFLIAVGVLEIIFIILGYCFVLKGDRDYELVKQEYYMALGFKRFTYTELKMATRGFSEEIGRGGSGVVYKGKFSDGRVAAIKRLEEVEQGEAEFLAEVSTIGRLNHKNLIEMWGYCAEGKHRLLVYEFLENRSLADNLYSEKLNWEKRLQIALGTAKGLCYLHEECLEWILHCDIKPQNILLDAQYQPKVADFGLSKLLSREVLSHSRFSRVRGTRGYMAPEWVYNLPITSKVDVYSYGIVLLEMVTGKNQTAGFPSSDGKGEREHQRLVRWVKKKVNEGNERESWMDEVIDPFIGTDDCDMDKMEIIVKVALQCTEEDKDARPTMAQVVQILLGKEDESASEF